MMDCTKGIIYEHFFANVGIFFTEVNVRHMYDAIFSYLSPHRKSMSLSLKGNEA